MHPYIVESHYDKYTGSFTSTYAIDTISLCVLFFNVITNEFIREEYYPSPNFLDGYEAMEFNVTQLTQDE
jgi:hypothetical protein